MSRGARSAIPQAHFSRLGRGPSGECACADCPIAHLSSGLHRGCSWSHCPACPPPCPWTDWALVCGHVGCRCFS